MKLNNKELISRKQYIRLARKRNFESKEEVLETKKLIKQYKEQIKEIKLYFKEIDDKLKQELQEVAKIKKAYTKDAKVFKKEILKLKDARKLVSENKEQLEIIKLTEENYISENQYLIAKDIIKNKKREVKLLEKELKNTTDQDEKEKLTSRIDFLKQGIYKEIDFVNLRNKQRDMINNLDKKIRNLYVDEEYRLKFIAHSYKEPYLDEYPELTNKFVENFKSRLGLSNDISERAVPRFDKDGREILLEVKKASVFFRHGRHVVKACNNLSFKVYKGETFGLVGESGSGKTTISRAIIGINKLEKGAIFFKGRNITAKRSKREVMNTKKNIQMIFQDPAASLNERANVDYIISEGLYNFKLYKDTNDRLKKVTDMIQEVGLLPEHLTRYPHEFSGGQRQRIGIARALVIQPKLVLADEPISALDVSIRAQVLNLLQKLQKDRQLTYLFIAHDLSIIRYISDRIGVMHQGYMVELGDAETIYSNPIHPYTRALLTAIPQPDPKSKNDRKKVVFNKKDLNYDDCKWIEVKPNHFVLGTDELIKKWLKNENK